MSLHELIYVSLAAKPLSDDELLALLEHTREKNRRNGVTGILVYHRREFMQLLEGEKDVVFSLYDTICRDARNQQNHLMWDGPIEARSFPDWSMAFVGTQELALHEKPGYSPFLEQGFAEQAHAEPSAGRVFLMSLREDFLRER